MQVTVSLGVVVLGLAVLMRFLGKATWLALFIAFTAGAMLAGSAAARIATSVTEGGAAAVQNGANSVSSGGAATTTRRPPSR